MKSLILIPAHNEENNIEASISGAQKQTVHADLIVICDNCTDNTEQITKNMRGKIFKTINNTHKKSGALNQALKKFMNNYDYILIQDADTTIAPNLLSIAINQLSNDNKLGAVCSKAGVKNITPTTWSEELWWRFQRIEYGIFDSSRIETLGNIKVLHGMATVYRTKALNDVFKKFGRVYDEKNITEDYELTICIKELKWEVTANLSMGAWTSVPTKFKELWIQRIRWFRGGIDVLRTHGLNRVTAIEFVQHGLFMILTTLNLFIMSMLCYMIYIGEAMSIHPLFYVVLAITTLDGLYRLRYVQNLHPKEIIIRIGIVPFSLYMQLYQAQQLWAYWLSLRNTKQRW